MFYSDVFLTEFERENQENFIQAKLKNYFENILPFYVNEGRSETFLGEDNLPISCRFFIHPAPKAKVVLVTGYNESYLKYAEFIHDLYNLNLSIFCFDHRGQGFSGKFFNQNKRGFIDRFEYMVEDFVTLFETAKGHQNSDLPIYVIGHSMGGTVVTTALCEQKINPNSVILSSPMFEINLTPWPIFDTPVYYLTKSLSILGMSKLYAIGQKDCNPFIPFDGNDITHSKYRFTAWKKHVAEIPDVQLGGPSFGWLKEAIAATHKLKKNANKNKIPLIILQAEEDTVIRNSAHDFFTQNCLAAKKVVLGHARHEIFMEIDFIRNKAFDVIKGVIRQEL